MKRRVWALVAAGSASAFGLAGAVQAYVSGMPGERPSYTLAHALIMELPYWYLWAMLLPAMVWFTMRHPFERKAPGSEIALHIVFGLTVTAVHTTAHVWFMHFIGHGFPRGEPFLPHLLHRARLGYLGNLLAYLLITALVFAVLYYQRFRDRETTAARLATQLSQAQLHALRMQLNPHFLFNALNAVSMLVRQEDNSGAVKMLGRLAGLLRTMLDEAPAHEWPLMEELRFIEQYLAIEQVRFSDRLSVEINAPADLGVCSVPALILQPLVENAVRHGIANRSGAGMIRIRCSRRDHELLIELEDDGSGFDRDVRGRGLGLENTRARLTHLYGDGERLRITNRQDYGTRVELTIPLHTEPTLVPVIA